MPFYPYIVKSHDILSVTALFELDYKGTKVFLMNYHPSTFFLRNIGMSN